MSATASTAGMPPGFLELAGHQVRWRLLTALSDSDLRVGELCTRLRLSQNLVSYHLRRLRSAGVVKRRRSTADGRDNYYTLDLVHCGELLAQSGAALHPGLRLVPLVDAPGTRTVDECRVLFLCTGNSARSQIAQALIEHMTSGAVDARSAGSHPKPLHPNAVRVMRGRGISIAGRRSRHLDEFANDRFDYVISLCDRVREVCPEFPRHPQLIHWSIPDPARQSSSDADTYPAFRRTADELETRIGFLLERIKPDFPEVSST